VGLDISLSGKSASDLGRVFGATVPSLSAFDFNGRLTGEGGKLAFDSLSAKLGGSDVSGHIALDPTTSPPTIDAGLVSSRLDLADFGLQAPEKSQAPSDGRVFSAEPWDLTPLQAVNASLKLNAQKVLVGTTELSNVSGELSLDSGKLKITNLVAGLG